MDDAERGDAYDDFVRSNYRPLLRTALGLTTDPHEAEDLLQTVLADVFVSWDKVGRAANPRGYVHAMLANRHVSRHRRRWWREVATGKVVETAATDDYASYDTHDLLSQGLRDMPARQRAAVVLRHLDGYSLLETADMLGCSVGTVKSLTSRGLVSLRACLGVDGGTPATIRPFPAAPSANPSGVTA